MEVLQVWHIFSLLGGSYGWATCAYIYVLSAEYHRLVTPHTYALREGSQYISRNDGRSLVIFIPPVRQTKITELLRDEQNPVAQPALMRD